MTHARKHFDKNSSIYIDQTSTGKNISIQWPASHHVSFDFSCAHWSIRHSDLVFLPNQTVICVPDPITILDIVTAPT